MTKSELSTSSEPILVLLAEDDMAHAEIVRRNLANCHVANHIVHVLDGQEAIDYLRSGKPSSKASESHRPHLILLDLRMPRLDGLQVIEELKSDPELKAIPIVVLTTSAAEADRLRAYQTGVNSYLVKPVDFEQFAQLMTALGYYWLAWNTYPFGTGA